MLTTSLIFSGPLGPALLAAEKPIRIGFSMALSGGLALAGKAGLLPTQICPEYFNKKGGGLGRPRELVYYNDHSKTAHDPQVKAGVSDLGYIMLNWDSEETKKQSKKEFDLAREIFRKGGVIDIKKNFPQGENISWRKH